MGYLAEPWTSWTSARETKESGGMRMTWCLWGLDLNPKSVSHDPEFLCEALTARARVSSTLRGVCMDHV